jgi:hypothetical protein
MYSLLKRETYEIQHFRTRSTDYVKRTKRFVTVLTHTVVYNYPVWSALFTREIRKQTFDISMRIFWNTNLLIVWVFQSLSK